MNPSFVPALWLLACLWSPVHAAEPVPTNVVSLSASGSLDVAQDWMRIGLSTTRDGADAAQVQTQLKTALDAALNQARSAADSQRMEVRTGQFSLYPRYASNGKINGWQGTVELWLEGRDFARISSTAGKIQTLTLASVDFSLSREARQKLEADAQAQAIERFRARAQEVAKGFGFSGYTLREVQISANEGGDMPRPRMMAMEAKSSMADAPVPVEAGKSTVSVTVSGAVQLR